MSAEISKESKDWIEKVIDPTLITDSANVSCSWASDGIWVDLNYEEYDELDSSYKTIFASPADEEEPSESIWADALIIARYLAERFHLPLRIIKNS